MIQKTITTIDALPKLEKLIRVAAYARVSSGKDAMLHSLSAQISYYQNLITAHQGWEFAGVYADEAITGTKENRDEFNRLISDCKKGKIDLIIVKAISRFARNTVTLIETVRLLKSLNVDVFFEEQNIHTISAEGEMVLTFLASFAQEEARSVSENMKWRIKKDFEKGLLWGSRDQLGYQIVNRALVIVPEEAELVKRIYRLYIDGYGVQAITNILNKEGIKSVQGKAWNMSVIRMILRNYNYTGDLILQKTYRENYLTKKKKRNQGELSQYLVEDDHEPIISKEMFYEVQKIASERAEHYNATKETNRVYPFTGLIQCGICKKNYRRKKGSARWYWSCITFDRSGKEHCNSKSIPEETLITLTKRVLKISEVTIEVVKKKIKFIEAFNDNKLVYHLNNGKVVEMVWQDLSRRNSWTPEMREKARQATLKRNKQKDGGING